MSVRKGSLAAGEQYQGCTLIQNMWWKRKKPKRNIRSTFKKSAAGKRPWSPLTGIHPRVGGVGSKEQPDLVCHSIIN